MALMSIHDKEFVYEGYADNAVSLPPEYPHEWLERHRYSTLCLERFNLDLGILFDGFI